MTLAEALDAYPYDPRYAGRADVLKGPEKLRAFEDPKMRESVYALWENTAGRGLPRRETQRVEKPASRAFIAPKDWNDTDRDDEGRPF